MGLDPKAHQSQIRDLIRSELIKAVIRLQLTGPCQRSRPCQTSLQLVTPVNVHLVQKPVTQLETAPEQDSTVARGRDLASSPAKRREPCPCRVSVPPAVWGGENAAIYGRAGGEGVTGNSCNICHVRWPQTAFQ